MVLQFLDDGQEDREWEWDNVGTEYTLYINNGVNHNNGPWAWVYMLKARAKGYFSLLQEWLIYMDSVNTPIKYPYSTLPHNGRATKNL